MTPRWPAPDFVPQRRPLPRLSWALLIAGSAVLAVALGEVLDMQVARDDAATRVAQLERRLRSSLPTPRPGAAQVGALNTAVTPEAARALRRIEQHLNQPWEQAFAGVESATPTGVQWLALEIENDPTRLRIEGLAPTADAALAIVDALAVRAGWSNVVLTRLQLADLAPGNPAGSGAGAGSGLQRFEVSARWSGSTPATATLARAEARP